MKTMQIVGHGRSRLKSVRRGTVLIIESSSTMKRFSRGKSYPFAAASTIRILIKKLSFPLDEISF
jgi:hypothetical protein